MAKTLVRNSLETLNKKCLLNEELYDINFQRPSRKFQSTSSHAFANHEEFMSCKSSRRTSHIDGINVNLRNQSYFDNEPIQEEQDIGGIGNINIDLDDEDVLKLKQSYINSMLVSFVENVEPLNEDKLGIFDDIKHFQIHNGSDLDNVLDTYNKD